MESTFIMGRKYSILYNLNDKINQNQWNIRSPSQSIEDHSIWHTLKLNRTPEN